MSDWKALALAVLLCQSPGPVAHAAEFTLLTHPWTPFTTGTSAAPSGLAVDIVRAILRRTGDSGEIQTVPYLRALHDVALGPSTVAFIVARTPPRESLMQWVGPIVVNPVYLYMKAGAPDVPRTLSEARKLRSIGVTRGDADAMFLEKLGFDNLDYSESQTADLRKLQLGRLDATPMGAIVFDHAAQEAGLVPGEFHKTEIKLYDSLVYVALSPDIPRQVIIAWSAALDTMKADGEYAALLTRYGISQTGVPTAPDGK